MISGIKLLDTLDPYEKQLLIDSFTEHKYEEGDYVIKQGEKGDIFFFVEEGEAIALKKLEGQDKA